MNWNLLEVKGTRDAAKAKLAVEKLPQSVKDFVAKQVDEMPTEFVKITAYSQDAENKSSMTLTRNIQVTIVGIKL